MKTKQTPAQKERAEQIKNAEAAYRNREITAEDLRWYRIITAKSITPSPTNGQNDCKLPIDKKTVS